MLRVIGLNRKANPTTLVEQIKTRVMESCLQTLYSRISSFVEVGDSNVLAGLVTGLLTTTCTNISTFGLISPEELEISGAAGNQVVVVTGASWDWIINCSEVWASRCERSYLRTIGANNQNVAEVLVNEGQAKARPQTFLISLI